MTNTRAWPYAITSPDLIHRAADYCDAYLVDMDTRLDCYLEPGHAGLHFDKTLRAYWRHEDEDGE